MAFLLKIFYRDLDEDSLAEVDPLELDLSELPPPSSTKNLRQFMPFIAFDDRRRYTHIMLASKLLENLNNYLNYSSKIRIRFRRSNELLGWIGLEFTNEGYRWVFDEHQDYPELDAHIRILEESDLPINTNIQHNNFNDDIRKIINYSKRWSLELVILDDRDKIIFGRNYLLLDNSLLNEDEITI